jgi:hypothetical protein
VKDHTPEPTSNDGAPLRLGYRSILHDRQWLRRRLVHRAVFIILIAVTLWWSLKYIAHTLPVMRLNYDLALSGDAEALRGSLISASDNPDIASNFTAHPLLSASLPPSPPYPVTYHVPAKWQRFCQNHPALRAAPVGDALLDTTPPFPPRYRWQVTFIGTCYIHSSQLPDGKRRWIIIDAFAMRWRPHIVDLNFRVVEVVQASWRDIPRVLKIEVLEKPVLAFPVGEAYWLRFGVPDSTDERRFSLEYRLGASQDVLDGLIDDRGQVHLAPRHMFMDWIGYIDTTAPENVRREQ